MAIVEDDSKLLSTLSKLISTDPEFEVVGGFPTTAAALDGIPRLNPDIVIMDINLPDISGVECTRRLKAICPGTQIMMLTVYEDTEAVFSALRAGASGYLLKQTPIEELLAKADQSMYNQKRTKYSQDYAVKKQCFDTSMLHYTAS